MLRKKLALKTLWLVAGAVILLFLVPVFTKNNYVYDLMIWIFLFTVFSTSVFQMAVIDRLLFGAGAFIGVGAYTSAMLTINLGLPFWPAMVLSGLTSGLIALAVGSVILKVRGVYFAIVTWSIGEVFITFYKEMPGFGGLSGIRDIPHPTIMGTPFVGKIPYYYLALGLMLLTLAFLYRLGKSRFGEDLKAIGASDNLAVSLGINAWKYRMMSFFIACFFLGLGGSFYAHYCACVQPFNFGILLSEQVFAYSVIGGVGSIWGGLIGSLFMTLIPEWMHAVEYLRPIMYGAGIVIMMVFMPGGLISLPRQIYLWRKGNRVKKQKISKYV